MKKKQEVIQKYEMKYEDDICIQTWKYDLKKSKTGPISVETEWKEINPNWIPLMTKASLKKIAKLKKDQQKEQ